MKNKLTALQEQRVSAFKKSLNPQSKWYAEDVRNFILNVANESPAQSRRMLEQINYMNSAAFEREVLKEERKMERAGLYNIGNMQPINALD